MYIRVTDRGFVLSIPPQISRAVSRRLHVRRGSGEPRRLVDICLPVYWRPADAHKLGASLPVRKPDREPLHQRELKSIYLQSASTVPQIVPIPCPVSTYKDTQGATPCAICPPGVYCAHQALTTAAGDGPCGIGYYCIGGATTPSPVDRRTGGLGPEQKYCPAGTM